MSKPAYSIISIFLFMALSLSSGAADAAGRPSAIVTFYPLLIHARNVAGDRFGVDVLLPPGAAVHDFAPKPSDVMKVASASVVIKNGAGLDDFVDRLVESSGNSKATIVDSSYGVELIRSAGTHQCESCGGNSGHADSEGHSQSFDPHTWLSIQNAVIQVKNIEKGLAGADPENASFYSQNAQKYIESLNALIKFSQTRLGPFAGRKFIVYHGPFSYFAKENGLVQHSIADAFGNAPSPAKIGAVYDIIKKEKIGFLVSEPAYQNKQIQSIADELKLYVIELDPIESYPAGAAFSNDYFTQRMKSNVEKLAAALEKK